MSVTQDAGDGKGADAAKPAANPNMRIWDANAVTPPSWTKRVQETKKSRPYTTVNAYRQIAAATRQFGPLGEGWGYDYELEYRGEGADELVLCHLTLWHGKRDQTIPVTTAKRTHMGRGADAWLDEDFPKKVVTDAITKALSYLGFSADVFFGLFDDVAYVQGAREREQQAEATGADGAELSVHAAKQRIAILMRRMGLDLALTKDALRKEHGVDALGDLDPDTIAAVVRRVEALGQRLTEIQSVCDALAEHGAPRWKAGDALRDWARRRGGEDNPLCLTDDEIRAFLEELQESVGDGVEATGNGVSEGTANGNSGVVTSARKEAAMIAKRMGIHPTEVIEALKRTYDVSRMEDLTPDDAEAFLAGLRERATLHARIQEHLGDQPATPMLKGWLKMRDANAENLLLVSLDQWRAWVAELDAGGPFAQAHAACSIVDEPE